MFPDLDQSGHSEEDLFSYTDDSPDLLGDETDDVFGSLKISNSSVTPYSDATQVRTALQHCCHCLLCVPWLCLYPAGLIIKLGV